MQLIWTDHATERWAERFSNLDASEEYGAAVPFGGQRHGDTAMLSPSGVVFIVAKDNVLKTVLTKEQAMANMANFHRSVVQVFEPVKPSAPAKKAKGFPALSNAAIERIQQIAGMVWENHKGCNSPAARKTRNEAMQESGIDHTRSEVQAVFKAAYWACRRGKNPCTAIVNI